MAEESVSEHSATDDGSSSIVWDSAVVSRGENLSSKSAIR